MQRIFDRNQPKGLTEHGTNVMSLVSGIFYLVGIMLMLVGAFRISQEVGLIAAGAIIAMGGLIAHRDVTRG